MRFNGMFSIDSWGISKFSQMIVALHAVMLCAIAMDVIAPVWLHIDISLIRQTVVFFYLIFVPGIVILRVLGVRSLSLIETALYSVCLSTAMLMFVGLLMNEIYPALGITKPIAFLPLIITIIVVVLLLLAIAYLKERPNLEDKPNVNHDLTGAQGISIFSIFGVAIPLIIGVVGVLLVNFFRLNTLLLLLFPIVSILIALASLGKLDHRLYPLAVLMIALALFFHFSLLSPYLLGWDINYEYYLSKLVETNSLWNPTIPITYNSALSITLLPVIYAQLMNVDIAWILKIVYPLIYSLVPLGLYETYRKQTSAVIAFLSVFFFMSFTTFFNEMLWLARQQLAVLFIVASILLILNKKIKPLDRNLLLLIFSASLVVSHYGTTYLYMLCVFLGILFLGIMKSASWSKLFQNLRAVGTNAKTVESQSPITKGPSCSLTTKRKILTVTSTLLLFVFALAWYTYVSSSAAIEAVTFVGKRVLNGSFSNLLSLSARDPTILHAFGVGTGIIQHESFRLVQYITLIFIAVGVLKYILNRRGTGFDEEYGAIMLSCTSIVVASIILPYFASALNLSRIYFFASIFLAPFCVLGGAAMLMFPFKNRFPRADKQKLGLFLVTIILLAYFLLSTGFIYEVTNDVPSSVSLSMEKMKVSNVTEVRVYLSGLVLMDHDVSSAEWLARNRNVTLPVYADYISSTHALPSYGLIYETAQLSNDTQTVGTAYIYLNQLNVIVGYMTGPYQDVTPWKTSLISSLLDHQDKIYSNGLCETYFSTPGEH